AARPGPGSGPEPAPARRTPRTGRGRPGGAPPDARPAPPARRRPAAGPGSTQSPDPLAGADHVGQAHAEAVVDHHHLAMGDQGAVDVDVQRFAGAALQLDHRALVELQQVADRHAGAPDFQRQGHRYVEDHVQVEVVAGQAGLGLQRVELRRGGGFVVHAGISSGAAALRAVSLPGGWVRVIFTALQPLDTPNWPVNTGMFSTQTGTVVDRSIGRMSPTFRRVSWRRSMRFCASTLETVTSASCSCSRRVVFQLSSRSMRSLWMPASSSSRIGSDRKSTRLNSSHVKISYA